MKRNLPVIALALVLLVVLFITLGRKTTEEKQRLAAVSPDPSAAETPLPAVVQPAEASVTPTPADTQANPGPEGDQTKSGAGSSATATGTSIPAARHKPVSPLAAVPADVAGSPPSGVVEASPVGSPGSAVDAAAMFPEHDWLRIPGTRIAIFPKPAAPNRTAQAARPQTGPAPTEAPRTEPVE